MPCDKKVVFDEKVVVENCRQGSLCCVKAPPSGALDSIALMSGISV